MMTKLREKTAVILWIVIFAFIGLIVVEWGADYSGTSQTSAGNTVGVVNGRKISHQEFRDRLSFAAQQQRQQPRGDADQEGRLVREIWDSFVSNILVNQEIERLGIEVTDQELAHYARTRPPADVQNLEFFQTDGEFDLVKYSQFITDPATYSDPTGKSIVRYIEETLRRQVRVNRLQRLVMETTQVSPSAVREHYVEQNEKVEVEYLFAPASAVQDDEVTVSEADLEAYYQEHLDQYHHHEQIKVAHVFWPRAPTTEDSLKILEKIEGYRREILDGTDFAELAEEVSEDAGTAASGGDLGEFGRGRMVPAFEEAAFGLPAGEISEPVLTRFGWHLIKVEERLEKEGEEKVRARHILLEVKASRQTEEALRTRVEDFLALAETRGFKTAAQIDSLQVQESPYLNKGTVVPGLGTGTAWLVNLFFNSEVGTISRWASNERGYWVAELVERRPEGVASLEEVRQQLERRVLNQKKSEYAGQQLEQIRQQVIDGASLAQTATAAALELRQPEPFSRSESVDRVGRKNAFVGAAFCLESGELSAVITLPQGSYLIHLVNKIPIDEEQFEAEREQVRQTLLRQRQSEVWQTWSAKVYESAEIEDNRHLFYTF